MSQNNHNSQTAKTLASANIPAVSLVTSMLPDLTHTAENNKFAEKPESFKAEHLFRQFQVFQHILLPELDSNFWEFVGYANEDQVRPDQAPSLSRLFALATGEVSDLTGIVDRIADLQKTHQARCVQMAKDLDAIVIESGAAVSDTYYSELIRCGGEKPETSTEPK